ncbi:MAG: hypothetical protein JWO86_4049 [Myxococcaceae bacterium]|nr:hypothetical protein [Myxococcaceae bacterium]
MRVYLGLLLAGSVALVACSGDDGGGLKLSSNPANASAAGTPAGGSTPSAATGPAAVACPATVPAATAISATDINATDVHIIPGAIIFRSDSKVIRIDTAAGGTRSEPYVSPDLVHSFADADVIVTIESPNPPDAVLKVMPVGGATMDPNNKTDGALTTTPAGWSAGGTRVFASDATDLYVLADVANQGDTIYRVSKADPNQMTQLANLDQSTLGDPQLAGTDVWFTRDQKRVYKVTQTPTDPANPLGGSTASDPTEIFAIGYATCNLAVGGQHSFCSTGKALEQRDLTGGNLETVLDAQKMAAPTLLGAAQFGTDTVFVKSLPSTATDALKNGIHAIKGTDDKLLVCGRETINAFAADDTQVVWAEQGKGVFSAPR